MQGDHRFSLTGALTACLAHAIRFSDVVVPLQIYLLRSDYCSHRRLQLREELFSPKLAVHLLLVSAEFEFSALLVCRNFFREVPIVFK